MNLVFSVLVVLAVNALPLWGFFGWELQVSQLLILFWAENLLQTVLVGARMWLHRRLTRKRGHWNVRQQVITTTKTRQGFGSGRLLNATTHKVKANGSALAAFALGAGVLTAGHAIFVGLLVFLLAPKDGSGFVLLSPDLLKSLGILGLTLGAGFLSDLPGISERPYAWIRKMNEWVLGRVVAIHLILLGGMFAIAFFKAPTPILIALVVIKLMADLSSVVPQMKTGQKPPGCLLFLNRFNKPGEESFDAYWARSHQQEEEQNARDEEVVSEEELERIRSQS